MPPEPTTAMALGDFLVSLAAIAAAGTLVAAVLAPPFLLFRSLAGRRSHRHGAIRRPGDTRA